MREMQGCASVQIGGYMHVHMYKELKIKKKIQACLKCRTKTRYNFKEAVCHSHLGMMQFILIFHPLSNTFKNFVLLICLLSSCTVFIGELFHRIVHKDLENFFFRDAVVVESTNIICLLVVLLNV